jgi:hypothetical protein
MQLGDKSVNFALQKSRGGGGRGDRIHAVQARSDRMNAVTANAFSAKHVNLRERIIFPAEGA